MKGAGGGRTLFGTVVLGEELAVKPGLQLRKAERKVIVAEQDGAIWYHWLKDSALSGGENAAKFSKRNVVVMIVVGAEMEE